MNILVPVVVGVALFYLGYRFYARYIARVFEENDSKPTPSVSLNDGIDYCPTKPLVLFSHHFASIAGAGRILGSALAMACGGMVLEGVPALLVAALSAPGVAGGIMPRRW